MTSNSISSFNKKAIPLTQGKFAFVDDEDYEWLSQWKWCVSHGYAVRGGTVNGKGLHIYMHREIAKTPLGLFTDHIDGDRLNNIKSNLRICTHKDNIRNGRKHKNNVSGFKGVYWQKRDCVWSVHIRIDGARLYLGSFKSLEAAALAYREAALKYHGEYMRLK